MTTSCRGVIVCHRQVAEKFPTGDRREESVASDPTELNARIRSSREC